MVLRSPGTHVMVARVGINRNGGVYRRYVPFVNRLLERVGRIVHQVSGNKDHGRLNAVDGIYCKTHQRIRLAISIRGIQEPNLRI